MSKNIEIKARVKDYESLCSKAESLSDTPCEILIQKDVFFHSNGGRLKLRSIEGVGSELIGYRRPDEHGPKTSEYIICPIANPALLHDTLSHTLGILGTVEKTRQLYRVGQTRVHLDRVDSLGDFLELEVVLNPNQPEKEGMAIAEDLMRILGIGVDSLVDKAYIDLICGGTK
ncbi:MAG: class IV adenylate cyclase [Armatimonadota bacterium]